jgi:ElaB/YqjD/DUF883 family membrane-anchored ribosome-binding protein
MADANDARVRKGVQGMKEHIETSAEQLAGAARDAAADLGRTGRRAANEARSEIGDFVDEVLGMLSDARSGSQEDVRRLRERVQEGAHRLKGVAVERQEQLRAAAGKAAEQADDYAHDNPWQVAAIAGAVGLLLGVLISRR